MKITERSFGFWLRSGEPWIWLTAGSVSISLAMVVGLLALITVKGLAHFWPAPLVRIVYESAAGDDETIIGEITDRETAAPPSGQTATKRAGARYLLKIGNRELYGLDFRWIAQDKIKGRSYPAELICIEREEWGNFYGYFKGVKQQGKRTAAGKDPWLDLRSRIKRKQALKRAIRAIEKDQIGAINFRLEKLRLAERGALLRGGPRGSEQRAGQRRVLQDKYQQLVERLDKLYETMNRDAIIAATADGRELEIPIANVVRVSRPNTMNWIDKSRLYFVKLVEFLSDEPREANTEGGVYPAIFGTVLMVLFMAVLVTPFGVLAAVYLHEYARQGPVVRLVRIAVNNLAGVPSVVYGVFGLGFFVYFLGGSIDRLFFAEALPGPTFGTPGLIWSSLTLAILTLPVVIVATEEGLTRIPRALREASYALGATKAETLWRTVLPMAAPAMLTGLVLAVARAAGEVAPLMLVGVVKLAPSLPIDGNFPYVHLERKFMHLGFHIYDVGFQSPNVEAARPLVFATALLLVVIIVFLNLAAITIRNRLREKLGATEH